MVNRLLVEKKQNRQAQALEREFLSVLKIKTGKIRTLTRYDIEGLDKAEFEQAANTILSTAQDFVYFEQAEFDFDYEVFALSFIDGQYDQLADLTAQNISLMTKKMPPLVHTATVYAISDITKSELLEIKKYLINSVESVEVDLEKPLTLKKDDVPPEEVGEVENFINLSESEIADFFAKNSFAMTLSDLLFVQKYFRGEKRNPTVTELKVIDTYWSDHCRHTTFLTELKEIKVNSDNPNIAAALSDYNKLFGEINGKRADKYPCLMDMATIAAKKLKKDKILNNVDESEEINACSINVKVDVDGKDEDYIVMFKNETHNHPTEIEPFGGAATCLGGGIRDPLSGRAYVFQSMRITGSGDPRTPYEKTLKGKLSQRAITKTAAAGFCSYGNQIGSATGLVSEIYHPGYVAKRMEAGFLVAAAKKEHIFRQRPSSDDVVILVGGKTGRDGCGGATGSSKSQSVQSSKLSSAEVQKGDPLLERAIIRLFDNKAAAKMIKKCNDFGAGGVCVAIGELADGLEIDLDKVPVKYSGLSGTELAISESQERMAVVVAKENAEKFIKLANGENLQATAVAKVTDTARMKIYHGGKLIVDLSREFLNTNGVKQTANAEITDDIPDFFDITKRPFRKGLLENLSDLNVCSQKGLVEMFDSTIGGRTIYLPLGGKHLLTPSIAMAAKIPVACGKTDSAAVSAFGYQPYLSEQSPYLGAVYAVLCSVAKLVACGVNKDTVRLTFQEYFHRLGNDAKRWGKPTAALLGALSAQMGLKLAAIGGKDSMSGSFESLDVPPALISFAIGIEKASQLICNTLENEGVKLYLLPLKKDAAKMPDFEHANALYSSIYENIQSKNIRFATVVESGGIAAAVVKSCLGNGIGFEFLGDPDYLLAQSYGNIIVAADQPSQIFGAKIEIGQTVSGSYIFDKESVSVTEAKAAFTNTLSEIFPINCDTVAKVNFPSASPFKPFEIKKTVKPKVLIPVFLGTVNEKETVARFETAGANAERFVFLTRTPSQIEQSFKELSRKIDEANILVLSGGFAGSHLPRPSSYITTILRNSAVANSINELLNNRGGLVLGFGGLSTLIKSGLLPHGEIKDGESRIFVGENISGQHISTVADIEVISNQSPWLRLCAVGEKYKAVISTFEGGLSGDKQYLLELAEKGMVSTAFSGECGDGIYAPGGAAMGIESIVSFGGRVLGMLSQPERTGHILLKNHRGNYDMKIFESGVNYFK